jgi:hypothetical protein
LFGERAREMMKTRIISSKLEKKLNRQNGCRPYRREETKRER